MSNHLKNETSPYLLQHAENPVDWYPWCDEAFQRAADEDKPVFLSIGYSTCHWCHVMAHESFEDNEIADILNQHFIAIKVDKEERPDIDSVYMSVCQAMTGSGGWPTSIFMTPEQKPFFAGTYFPKNGRRGSAGLMELLLTVRDKWENDRERLLRSADEISAAVETEDDNREPEEASLIERALSLYRRSFDEKYGGFGTAPKFPAAHNLLFLLQQYEKHGDGEALCMAETTLRQMYLGGLFDHIGGGFCRYSTDRYFLVPHFEKMLYDNALLISAYSKAYELTQNGLYAAVAEKTAAYILTEMTAPSGGFYSAQDADSEGKEGRYYVFSPDEIIELIGREDGEAFCACYDIMPEGNFEQGSIPNLLKTKVQPERFSELMPRIRDYRKKRTRLHTDDKILTLWNSLMISALCSLYRITRDDMYLSAAENAGDFIEKQLCEGSTLYVSFRAGKRGGKGFLDDYAAYALALLALYDATMDSSFLHRAVEISKKAINDFFDSEKGGFYLYGAENEALFIKPKESYDGALPSGNSMMTAVLTRLEQLVPETERQAVLKKQLAFMAARAEAYPPGYSQYLMALSDYYEPPVMITAVGQRGELSELPFNAPIGSIVKVQETDTAEYKRLNGKPGYYICRGHSCHAPVNALTKEMLRT